MCRILYNPNNKRFDKKELRESYLFNPDGTGLYYYDGNRSVVKKWEKGTDFEEIWQTISKLEKCRRVKNVALHFRYGTSGGLGEDQTHPIRVNENIFLMHNGVCKDFEWDSKLLSDTQCIGIWTNALMRKFDISNISWLINPELIDTLEERFSGNKLLYLQKDKGVIINEHLGEWGNDGIWRSWKNYSKLGWD